MANNFWTASPTQDPKRQFRFRVQITGIGGTDFLWYAKTATKPEISFGEAEHNYLNHRYYWPGRTEWSPVTVTLTDPVDPDLAESMAKLLEAAGYRIPEGSISDVDFGSMSKSGSVTALDTVLVEQIDEEGKALETWTLKNAWVKKVTFGNLDYSNDDLTEVTLEFRYDWATLDTHGASPFFVGP
jgi:hypothetical protein